MLTRISAARDAEIDVNKEIASEYASTHLRALSFVAKEDLAKPPERIGRLIDRIEKAVSPT